MKSFIQMAMCLLALGILVVAFVYVLGPTSLRNLGPGHVTVSCRRTSNTNHRGSRTRRPDSSRDCSSERMRGELDARSFAGLIDDEAVAAAMNGLDVGGLGTHFLAKFTDVGIDAAAVNVDGFRPIPSLGFHRASKLYSFLCRGRAGA